MGGYLSNLYDFLTTDLPALKAYPTKADEQWVEERIHRLHLYNAEVLQANPIIPGSQPSEPIPIR